MSMTTFEPRYSVPEAAAILQVSAPTLWKWIREGRIKTTRISPRTTRVSREAIERLLNQGVQAQ